MNGKTQALYIFLILISLKMKMVHTDQKEKPRQNTKEWQEKDISETDF